MSQANNYQPVITAFCCENSALLAYDLAKEKNLTLPNNLSIVKLPCSGKIDVIFLLKALENGADGVLVAVCQKENCKFLKGNIRAQQRIGSAQNILAEIGIEKERIAFINIAANMGHKFAEEVYKLNNRLLELGPNPGKVVKG